MSRLVVMVSDRSADGSRRVRNMVVVPGLRVIWATCPSTQTQPRRASHDPIFWLTTRTGQGCSGEDGGSGSPGRVSIAVAGVGSVTAEACQIRRPYHGRVTEARKRVLLAKPRGYCAGVDRAVQTVEEALKLYGPPIYVRKEIVHNRHVVSTLQAKGAIFVEENAEVPEGSIVVFSAHGVAPEVYEQANARSLRAIDATCPLVTKVH